MRSTFKFDLEKMAPPSKKRRLVKPMKQTIPHFFQAHDTPADDGNSSQSDHTDSEEMSDTSRTCTATTHEIMDDSDTLLLDTRAPADSNEAWVARNFPTDVGLFGKSISDDDRLYLTSHAPCQPTEKDLPTKQFPKKVQGDRSRSFQESWYDKKLESGKKIRRKWLIYSILLDAMFCLACFLFSPQSSISSGRFRYSVEWSNSGVSNWKKGAEKIKEHEMSEGHQFCCTRWQSFTSDTRIDQLMDKERAREAQRRKEQVEKINPFLQEL